MIYTDIVEGNEIIRTFATKDRSEIGPWHRDEKDRIIEVLYVENNCLFQLDNELPQVLYVGYKFSVPAMKYHRVFMEEGKMKLKITEK